MDNIGVFASLEREGLVFKLFGQFALLEGSEPSALGRRRSVRLFCKLVPLGALAQLIQERVGLGLRLSQFGRVFRLGSALFVLIPRIGAGLGLSGYQDLAQVDLFRPLQFFLVLVVIVLDFLVADADMRAHLADDHLLVDGAGADLVLEIFVGDALLLGFLLQGVHAGQS